MKLPWRTIKVHCNDMQELANLLGWLRRNSGLSEMAKTEFAVTAETNGPLTFPGEDYIKGFYVEVPYAVAKKILLPQQIEISFLSIKQGGS